MKKTVSSGEIIIKREEISPYLYIILIGKVRIEDSHGIYYLSKNDFFGEEGVFLKKPSSCTVIASDETEVMILPEAEVLSFIKEYPDIAMTIIRKNIARACNSHKQFNEKNYYYQRLLEILISALPQESITPDFMKTQISLITVAEKIGLPIPSVRALFTMAQPMGDLFLDKESIIHAKNASYLRNRIQKMSLEQYFGLDKLEGEKGVGHFNLLYLLNNNIK